MIKVMPVRCPWLNLNNKIYIDYHDHEWGLPVHDDDKLFEILILEGAQAGLSWEIILNKRQNYRKAFDNFSPEKIALYDNNKQNQLIDNKGIVRNKLKIKSVIKNAQVFLAIQQEFNSFNNYIWRFVDYQPVINHFKTLSDYPVKTELSSLIAKDLQKRGMSFVGPIIIYSFMQAIGMVNDHTISCFAHDLVTNK